MNDVHGFKEVDVRCQDCPKILKSRIGFSLHRKGKHGPRKECPICRKWIPSSTMAFKKHLKSHNMHRCEHCGKEISDSSDHVEQEHGAKVGCPVCKKDVPERILDGHVKAHSNSKQGCLKCGLWFQSNMSLKLHNREIHMGRPLDRCSLCDKMCLGAWDLNRHMKEDHVQKRTEVCKVCGEAFQKRAVMLNHMKIVHGNKSKCVVCLKLVPNFQLKTHMGHHASDKQYICHECGAPFIRSTLLRSHILMKHTPRVVCTVCGIGVHSVNLSTHLQKHSTVKSKCDQCGAEYKNERSLKKHVKDVHSEGDKNPPLLCQTCGRGFRDKFLLKQHQLRHEEPKHQCPDCPKKFFTEQQMQSHSKIHTRGHRFECSNCPKVFVSEKRLQTHVDTAHLGLRPHACPKCPETFKHVLGMMHHVKVVHEGKEKQTSSPAVEEAKMVQVSSPVTAVEEAKMVQVSSPVTAVEEAKMVQVCGKAFNASSNQRRHELSHRKGKFFHCSVCGKWFRSKLRWQDDQKKHEEEKQAICALCGEGFLLLKDLEIHLKWHIQGSS
ncbi:unnamed protein product [Cyprideis torosa]|uniref:Uncharacterized protein n=1 Tax=Cyprideis torosa TaxID=163714 RepID=A0A7R8WAQ8_9CRUS|nr:unnamed protein product [Cyprideis torosa]CAG0886599.1 unnamed protein product [Cyprideis torosa]